jgi:hypothetical protein
MARIVTAPEPRLGARILSVAECADAVLLMLQSASLSKQFNAVREWLPRFDLADLGFDVKVIVTAGDGYVTTRIARDSWQREPQIRIVVCARLGEEPYDDEIDGLMSFVEEIRHLMSYERLPDAETWKGQRRPHLRAVLIENEPVLATDTLEQMRQFTSVLTVTFRVME